MSAPHPPRSRHHTKSPTSKIHCSHLLVVAVVLFAVTHLAGAQAYPSRPIRLVVPAAPGGGTDIVARMFATRLSAEFGQQFIVDNRSGAGGIIGAEIAARAIPDGYTIITVPASYAANAALYKLPYDPVNGISPVTMMTTGPLILTVNPSVPATTLKEFIGLLHAKPGAIAYGSSGTGTFSHLTAELFRQMSKTDMVHVPYKGAGPVVADLLGGQIQMFFASGPSSSGHIRAGRLRALGVTTEKRLPALPDVPAIGEFVPGYIGDAWHGLFAPAGTPQAVVDKLSADIAKVLAMPEVRAKLANIGLEPVGTTPAEFAAIVRNDHAKWGEVIRNANIKLD